MEEKKGKVIKVNFKDKVKAVPWKMPRKADNENIPKKQINKLNAVNILEKLKGELDPEEENELMKILERGYLTNLSKKFMDLKVNAEKTKYSVPEVKYTMEALTKEFTRQQLVDFANNEKNHPTLKNEPELVLAIYKILSS